MSAPAQWRCLGLAPHQPPCDATISSDAAAEKHVQATDHAVVSGLVGDVLDRAVARFELDTLAAGEEGR